MGKVVLGDLSWFLRPVFPEPEPEMAERLVEMCREWCGEKGITLSGGRGEGLPHGEPEARPEPGSWLSDFLALPTRWGGAQRAFRVYG